MNRSTARGEKKQAKRSSKKLSRGCAPVEWVNNCTGFVVTEYGAANLKGKSTWERAEMLINIAHPDFRDDMIRQAEKMGIWSNSSKRQY